MDEQGGEIKPAAQATRRLDHDKSFADNNLY
jgi:hypothetical protein